jgi:hypothetical protein
MNELETSVQAILSKYIGDDANKDTFDKITSDLNKHFGDSNLSWTFDRGDKHLTFSTTLNGKSLSLTYRHNF